MSDYSIFRLIIKGPDFEQTYTLSPGTTILGRQPDCGLCLNHSQVSRQHTRIDLVERGLKVTDLGSSNGTWVNGEKIAPHLPVSCPSGSRIRVGPFEMVVEKEENGEEKTLNLKGVGSMEETPTLPKDLVGPPSPPEPPHLEKAVEGPDPSRPPPGLDFRSRRLLAYLPGIFHDDITARFLGIFEAILIPIEWQVDNIDLYLHPATCPPAFLSWLENWFNLVLDNSWSESQKRILLREARQIYARRGTRWSLQRLLEIYTEKKVEIIDHETSLPSHTFKVKTSLPKQGGREQVEELIRANKPAHTNFILEITG